MKKNNIRVCACSLATLQILALSSCNTRNTQNVIIEEEEKEEVGVQNTLVIPESRFNFDNFVPINENTKMALNSNAIYYSKDGKEEGILEKDSVVEAIKTDGKYTLISFDNEQYVIESSYLYEVINVHNSDFNTEIVNRNYITVKSDYLYNSEGLIIGYVNENTNCYVVGKNEEYTLVILEDGKDGFIRSENLEVCINLLNSYAYSNNDTIVYSDCELSSESNVIKANNLIYTLESDGIFVKVISDGIEGYARLSDLILLDGNFINIDLTDQRIDCYIDNELVQSWGTRSGKDSTPTHEGVFDIDWKAYDFEFTTYAGSYAYYWIPYNEYGEGIHDLRGDDEQNYGNESYHIYGSHGCVRVPVSASEFVYNNYEAGSLVLVHK